MRYSPFTSANVPVMKVDFNTPITTITSEQVADFSKVNYQLTSTNLETNEGFVRVAAFQTCLLYTSPSPRDS